MPQISVVMPVYNGEKYLNEAIDSILNQTFSDFEFIIINDCSTDNTENIIKSYEDNRIVYIKNKKNLGVAESLNKGLDIAKGEYIARMDADDISFPNRFEKQVRYMDRHKDIVVCGTAIEWFGDVKKEKVYTVFGKDNMKINLLFGSCLYHPTVMIRKSILDKEGYRYNPEYDKVEDFELWTRIVLKYDINNLKRVLLRYRKHNNQVTQNYEHRHKERLVKVISNFLYAIGVKWTESEKDAFISFCFSNLDYESQFAHLISIFNKIEYNNRTTNFFNKRKLALYLSRIIFSYYTKQGNLSKKGVLNLCNFSLKMYFYKAYFRFKTKDFFKNFYKGGILWGR